MTHVNHGRGICTECFLRARQCNSCRGQTVVGRANVSHFIREKGVYNIVYNTVHMHDEIIIRHLCRLFYDYVGRHTTQRDIDPSVALATDFLSPPPLSFSTENLQGCRSIEVTRFFALNTLHSCGYCIVPVFEMYIRHSLAKCIPRESATVPPHHKLDASYVRSLMNAKMVSCVRVYTLYSPPHLLHLNSISVVLQHTPVVNLSHCLVIYGTVHISRNVISFSNCFSATFSG